jgi:hypothetical protein
MRAHITAGLVALVVAAAGCGGKGAEGTCPTYAGCGGDPKGDWVLSTGCQNLIVFPYQQPDQLAQPQTPTQAPPQPQPTTSGDWCSQLIYQPSIDPSRPIKSVVLWHGPPTVHDGFMHINDQNHTFDAEIQFRTQEHTFFSNACLTRYERVAPTCDQLGKALAEFEASQPGFMFADSMVCTGDSSVGCDCSYLYQVQSEEMGTWSIDPAKPSTIVFASVSRTEPQSATFCQNGNSLQLSGENGTNLFSAAGVRSATFTR